MAPRSASRMPWMTTCLAVWAAMRPNFWNVHGDAHGLAGLDGWGCSSGRHPLGISRARYPPGFLHGGLDQVHGPRPFSFRSTTSIAQRGTSR